MKEKEDPMHWFLKILFQYPRKNNASKTYVY